MILAMVSFALMFLLAPLAARAFQGEEWGVVVFSCLMAAVLFAQGLEGVMLSVLRPAKEAASNDATYVPDEEAKL